jgi:hypothetical protein
MGIEYNGLEAHFGCFSGLRRRAIQKGAGRSPGAQARGSGGLVGILLGQFVLGIAL